MEPSVTIGERTSLLEMTCIRKTSAMERLCNDWVCFPRRKRMSAHLTSGRYIREMRTCTWAQLEGRETGTKRTSPFWLKIKNPWRLNMNWRRIGDHTLTEIMRRGGPCHAVTRVYLDADVAGSCSGARRRPRPAACAPCPPTSPHLSRRAHRHSVSCPFWQPLAAVGLSSCSSDHPRRSVPSKSLLRSTSPSCTDHAISSHSPALFIN